MHNLLDFLLTGRGFQESSGWGYRVGFVKYWIQFVTFISQQFEMKNMRESQDLAVLLMGLFNPELQVSRRFS
jgi:hypothetical protein